MSKKTKKKLWAAVGCVCLVSVIAIGATLAYFTDSDTVTNTFVVGDDIDITINEPHWDPGTPDDPSTPDIDESTPGDGGNMTPGTTKVKDPIITCTEGSGYARVVIKLIDMDTGAVIDDAERANYILSTLHYDDSYNATATPPTANIVPGTMYSSADVAGYPMTNEDDFELDAAKSGSGVYYYNGGLVNEGDTAVLFTNVVIPTDWNQSQLKKMGNYKIEICAQVIQADAFANAQEAYAALDAEVAANTIQSNS